MLKPKHITVLFHCYILILHLNCNCINSYFSSYQVNLSNDLKYSTHFVNCNIVNGVLF